MNLKLRKSNRSNSRLCLDRIFNIPKSNRSQAAMEFLMTYGWAILAAVIAIGVLAYFGVFSPGKYITGNAIIGAPFSIDESAIKAGSGISLVLRNGGMEDYNIISIEVSGCGINDTLTTVTSGTTFNFFVGCPSLSEGDKIKGDITVTYIKLGGSLNQVDSGSISGIAKA
jgi:hypothetical protein